MLFFHDIIKCVYCLFVWNGFKMRFWASKWQKTFLRWRQWATFDALRCQIWSIRSRNTRTWHETWSSLPVRLLLGLAPTTWQLFRYAWLTFPLHKIHIHLFACSTWTYHVIELPPLAKSLQLRSGVCIQFSCREQNTNAYFMEQKPQSQT